VHYSTEFRARFRFALGTINANNLPSVIGGYGLCIFDLVSSKNVSTRKELKLSILVGTIGIAFDYLGVAGKQMCFCRIRKWCDRTSYLPTLPRGS
jgi:hypothetical protein